MTLTTLQQYLDDYLFFDKTINIEKIEIHMADGLIVRGKEEIGKISGSNS